MRRHPLDQVKLGLILVLYTVSSVFAQEESPCTVHANGKYYDLNPLKASQDYKIQPRTGKAISLNMCQSVRTEMFGLKDGITDGDVAGFLHLDHGAFAIGKINSSLAVFDSRPRVTFSGGSKCRAGQATENIRASSVIEFVCDKSVSGVGEPRLIAALPPGDEESGCGFVFEWKTSYACPTSEGFGLGSFFMTLGMILLALLLTYTIAGTLYNRFVLDLRGYDQVPQFSLESMKYHAGEAFEWTKDMAGIISVNFFSGQSRGGSGYNTLASENPRTPNPVSHQAQVSSIVHPDIENNAGLQTSTAFVQPKTASPASFARSHQINPASHQAQVAQSLSFTAASQAEQQPTQVKPNIAVEEEEDEDDEDDEDDSEDDDDEDAQELVDISTLGANSTTQAAPTTSTQSSSNQESAATARGRDLGSKGNILL